MRRLLQRTIWFLILVISQTGVSFMARASDKHPGVNRAEDNPDTTLLERKAPTALGDRVQAGLGFLEKSDANLLKLFSRAWHSVGCGELYTESVVLIFQMNDGSYAGKLFPYTNEYEKVSFRWDPHTIAIVHTHPNKADPEPSMHDEEVARHLAVPIFTITRHGMYVYNPASQRSRRLMNGLGWLDPARWTHQVFISAAFGSEK